MRQAGICAAACLHALDHHVEGLAEDHENARRLATGLAGIHGIAVEVPETNLVFFDTLGTGMTADVLAARLRRDGIAISVAGPYRARACTHLDVDRAGIEAAVGAIGEAVADLR